MSPLQPRSVAWAATPQRRWRTITAIAVSGTLVAILALASIWWRQRPIEVYLHLFLALNVPAAIILLWMSRLVLLRRPGNGAGRLLLAMGLVSMVHAVAAAVADARITAAGLVHPDVDDSTEFSMAALPLDAAVPTWIAAWIWVPVPVLAATTLLLIFPDGRLPGPGWRWAAGAALGGAALVMLGWAIDAWPASSWTSATHPRIIDAMLASGGLLVLGAVVASVVAIGLRWRRAPDGQRHPYRVVAATAGTMAVAMILLYPTPWWDAYVWAAILGFFALLTVYALAVARYRLHDLEPFLGRTAVAGALALSVVAVYVLVVFGVGALVSRRFGHDTLALLAVAIVALGIEPVRAKARQLVERLLFRRRADRSEVVSRLAARTGSASRATGSAGVEVLGDAVELLLRSTGARRAEAWLGSAMVAAVGPPHPVEPVLQTVIAHGGRDFGALRLFAHASVDLTPDAADVLADVANVVGSAIHNDHLAAELGRKVDQLQAVSRRLVEAQDAARRGLERDLHDGVQTQLLSIRLRAGAAHAQALLAGQRELAGDLGTIVDELDSAVTALRTLARGVHPPVLRSSGLVSALTLCCQDLALPVTIEADGVGRYEPAVEMAVYFACLEAVQNGVRHAAARRVTVHLVDSAGVLRFTVADDGCGFDPADRTAWSGLTNMDDRVTALRGTLVVDSAPGRGTRVTGFIPVQQS